MLETTIKIAWPAGSALVIAATALLCLTLPRRGWVRTASVLVVSAAGTWLYVSICPTARTPLQHAAWLGAALSLLWSACAAAVLYRDDQRVPRGPNGPRFVPVAHVAALLFGVVPAVVQSLVLIMRGTFVAIDLIRGYPWNERLQYGFTADGLWSLGLLSAACAVSLVSTRDMRLVTCQFWLGVMLVLWFLLDWSPLKEVGPGLYQRTPSLLLLTISLAGLLLATAVVLRISLRRFTCPALKDVGTASTDETDLVPGFWVSFRIAAVVVVVLVCYHLLVPLEARNTGPAACSLVACCASALVACAATLLIKLPGGWQAADVLIGAGSLALCALATAAQPAGWGSLAVRYPSMFSAMIVGLTAACLLCVWLATPPETNHRFAPSRGTEPAIAYAARRFVFLNAALAVLIGLLMALWPRLPSIATMDDSYGRVTSGLAANLLLLLVLLWCSRHQRRPAFHMLTLLCFTSTMGFLIVRMLPYTSSIR